PDRTTGLESGPRHRMQNVPPAAGSGRGATHLAAIVSVDLEWGLLRERTPAGAAPTGPARPAPERTPRGPEAPAPSAMASSARELSGLEAQLARTFPARNAIESARNATVFIKTAWGMG